MTVAEFACVHAGRLVRVVRDAPPVMGYVGRTGRVVGYVPPGFDDVGRIVVNVPLCGWRFFSAGALSNFVLVVDPSTIVNVSWFEVGQLALVESSRDGSQVCRRCGGPARALFTSVECLRGCR